MGETRKLIFYYLFFFSSVLIIQANSVILIRKILISEGQGDGHKWNDPIHFSLRLPPHQHQHLLPLLLHLLIITMTTITTIFLKAVTTRCSWASEAKIPAMVLRLISTLLCVKKGFTPSWTMTNSREVNPFLQNCFKQSKVRHVHLSFSRQTMLLQHGVWTNSSRLSTAWRPWERSCCPFSTMLIHPMFENSLDLLSKRFPNMSMILDPHLSS